MPSSCSSLASCRRRLAVDRAMLDLAVVHLARLLGKFLADIVGILGEVVAQLLQLRAELALLRRHHRDRGGSGAVGAAAARRCAGGAHRRAFPCAREPRRHDRLLDLGGTAHRAGDEAALDLLVVGGGVLEPAFELVAFSQTSVYRIMRASAPHAGGPAPPSARRSRNAAMLQRGNARARGRDLGRIDRRRK